MHTPDPAVAEAVRAANRERLQPLIDAGVGTDQPVNITIAGLSLLLRGSVADLTLLDPHMSNLLTSTAGVLETLNNRVRRLWDENAEPAPLLDGPEDAPPEEAEA